MMVIRAMGIISEEHKQHLRKEFEAKLKDEVRLVMFTQETECAHCKEARELVQELAELSDKITVEIHDFVKEGEKARELKIDKVPAIAITGKKDYGLRYYGVPLGYEFKAFLDNIINVSNGTTNLSEDTKEKLKSVSEPVHIQVFVTLTCPYCPTAASLAYKCALESDLVRTDVIDVGEFPHLAQKYSVMGVPKTVINEQMEIVGAIPEAQFVAHVLQAQKTPGMYM
jgi:glutaredoxin-like protein